MVEPSPCHNPISSKRSPPLHILFSSTALRYKKTTTGSGLEMAHAHPCVPTMARSYIHISAPLGGAPRHSQEVARDAIGFLPTPPLSVWYDSHSYSMSEEQKADVSPAFEHSEPHTRNPSPCYDRLFIWISICNKSFLELEHLALSGFVIPSPYPMNSWVGSTSPRRLRNIFLDDLYSFLLYPSFFRLAGILSLFTLAITLSLVYNSFHQRSSPQVCLQQPGLSTFISIASSPYRILPRFDESKLLTSRSHCSPRSFLPPLRRFHRVH